jgi:hypothetical protein
LSEIPAKLFAIFAAQRHPFPRPISGFLMKIITPPKREVSKWNEKSS